MAIKEADRNGDIDPVEDDMIAVADAEPEIVDDLNVVIHIDRMTIGDYRRLKGQRDDKKFNEDSFLDLLDRVVEGGIDAIPISDLPALADALIASIGDSVSPKGRRSTKKR